MTAMPAAAPERDRYGRYMVHNPKGHFTAHTRATTLASTLSDTFGLMGWKQRVVAVGMAKRPDLVALAANKTCDDKDALREVVEAAEESGGANDSRRFGTGLHEMLERLDLGLDTNVPAQFRPHIDAYQATMSTAGIRILPEGVERVIIVDELTVAGTTDRIIELDGSRYIADLKTGKDPLQYGAGEIAIQLALYAHGSALWDTGTKRREPMPEVDQTRALVIHLPAAAENPECTLHWVDITAGWAAAHLARQVRKWRKKKKKELASPFTVSVTPPLPLGTPVPPSSAVEETPNLTPPPEAASTLVDGLKNRIAWIVENSPKGVQRLTAGWPADVPTFAALRETGGHHSEDQLHTIRVLLDRVEGDIEAPFMPPVNSGLPRPDSRGVQPIAEWPDLVDVHSKLTTAGRAAFSRWALSARDLDRAWDLKSPHPNTRKLEIALAACGLAEYADPDGSEQIERLIITRVFGPLNDDWPTGAVLGCLSLAQAQQLRSCLADLEAGYLAVTFDMYGDPQIHKSI